MEQIPSIERKKTPEVYFSVSNLVRNCIVVRADGKRDVHEIAILGKVGKDGSKRFQAIGGGAKMTDEAIAELKKEYPDTRFRPGEEHDDARFYIPIPEKIEEGLNGSEEAQKEAQRELDDFEKSVLEKFLSISGEVPLLKQDDVRREVIEELLEENKNFSPVLSERDLEDIAIKYTGAVSPIKYGEATSGRSDGAIGYGRLFYLYDIVVSEHVFETMKKSEGVRFLSPRDRDSIKTATERGLPQATLADGATIVENIFPDFYEERS